ncbi:MAG: bacillithiol biosynthesis deacetylase BshB1 [Planctomycetaceae bacterium]|jgi:N-acetylglucosamine malate deacetylase 1|nr:bacillithiol biosynthesis deacetylase BshB1 [Planctomycetaceae bacterium]MBT6642217.1 bacillithiol biosynthesis deacetylase BshB1 [Planctomycetaceae bacterium]
MLDALIIAAHPDDAEIGMGGTILRMLEDGLKVGILDLTNGEPTPLGTPEIRMCETKAASDVLGVTWRNNLGLPNRKLQHDLAARAALAGIIRESQPRWLFTHYWVDAHPDHVAACELTEAARFWSKLTKCELPFSPHFPERIFHFWSVHQKTLPHPAFIVDTSKTREAKQKALLCYKSQFPPLENGLSVPERVAVGDAWWGTMIGTAAGEPFACREPIALSGFGDLR